MINKYLTKSLIKKFDLVFSHKYDDFGKFVDMTLKIRTYIIKKILKNELMDIDLSKLFNKTFEDTNFYKKNFQRLEPNGKIKIALLKQLIIKVKKVNKNLNIILDEKNAEVEIENTFNNINNDNINNNTQYRTKEIDDKTFYVLKDGLDITDIYNINFLQGGETNYYYNFNNYGIKKDIYDPNLKQVQRCEIAIVARIEERPELLIAGYFCPKCKNISMVNLKELCSVTSYQCQKKYVDNKGNEVMCKKTLTKKSKEYSIETTAYYYSGYFLHGFNKGKMCVMKCYNILEPGIYDTILIPTNEDNIQPIPLILTQKLKEQNLLDFKKFITKDLDSNPKNSVIIKNLEIMQQEIDNINTQNPKIEGLWPIKLAFMIQKFLHVLNPKKIFNMSMIGSGGTGKSLTNQVLGEFYYKYNFEFTEAKSISIPALRGSKQYLGSKTVITPGMLRLKSLITINELSTNPELQDDMKGLLDATTFNNNKIGGDSTHYRKTALINVTENIKNFKSIYIGMVKKDYEKQCELLGETQKWNPNWDLYQHDYYYIDCLQNKALAVAILNIRSQLKNASKHWIDGQGEELDQRYFMKFFLLKRDNEKIIKEYKEKKIFKGIDKEKEEEKFILNGAGFDNIDDFFITFYKKYYLKDFEYNEKRFFELLKKYYLNENRYINYYLHVLNVIRCLDMKTTLKDLHYNILEVFLYYRNRGIYTSEMQDIKSCYELNYWTPPDTDKNINIVEINNLEQDNIDNIHNIDNIDNIDSNNDFDDVEFDDIK